MALRLQHFVNETSLKCKICKRIMVEPRVLPCLHTFCARCLVPLIKREVKNTPVSAYNDQGCTSTIEGNTDCHDKHSNTCTENEIISFPINSESEQQNYILQCPSCESENKLDDVSKLPLNYMVLKRMVTVLQQSSVCTQCSGDMPTSGICVDCQFTLCTFCSNVHQQKKGYLTHEIISLQDINPIASGVHNQVMCEIHCKRELRLYCILCSVLVCRDCCMELHRTHPYETASKIARQYKNSLKEALSKAQPLARETVLSLTRLQNLNHRIQARCKEVEKEIESFTFTYKLSVEEHCRVLLREVDQIRQNKLSALNVFEQNVRVRSEQTNQAVNFTQEVLNDATDIEMLSVMNVVMSRLTWCQETPPISVSKISDCLIFLPEEQASVINNHPMYGVVTTQAISPYHCTLETEGLLNCHQYNKAEFVLRTCDSDGQQLCHGGEKIQVELHYVDTTLRQIPVKVMDKGDGSYVLIFTPDAPGNLSLNIRIHHKNIQGSPFNVSVSTQKPHPGIYHCCTFCSSNGNKNITCACESTMPGYNGCGHGHDGHPGQRHWSCCGSLFYNSECTRNQET